MPLDQATTPSLEALKAYSLGIKAHDQEADTAAIPSFKRAVELDPNFAMAYSALGVSYSNLDEPSLASENVKKAYEMRDRVSEREDIASPLLTIPRSLGSLRKLNKPTNCGRKPIHVTQDLITI